jgi:hypothetical protein
MMKPTFFSQAVTINDLYIVEGNSAYNNDNIIILGTSAGGIVIEERKGDEVNSRFKFYMLDT